MTDVKTVREKPIKRYLEVVEIKTGEVVTRIDVSGRSESAIEKCTRGMLINMSEKFFVRDTGDRHD